MFVQPLLKADAFSAFSPTALAHRLLLGCYLAVTAFLFTADPNPITALIFMTGVLHANRLCKIEVVESAQTGPSGNRNSSTSARESAVRFHRRENRWLVCGLVLSVIESVWLMLKLVVNRYFSNKMHLLFTLAGRWHSSLFASTTDFSKNTLLAVAMLVAVLWLNRRRNTVPASYDFFTVRVLSRLTSLRLVRVLQLCLVKAVLLEAFLVADDSLFKNVERFVLVAIALKCHFRYQVKGVFGARQLFDDHRRLCVARTVCLAFGQLLMDFGVKAKVVQADRGASQVAQAVLAGVLFLAAHCLIHFSTDFHRLFKDREEQADTQVPPPDALFLSHFAEQLTSIMCLSNPSERMNDDCELTAPFFKGLSADPLFLGHFRRTHQPTLVPRKPTLTKRLRLMAAKLQLPLVACFRKSLPFLLQLAVLWLLLQHMTRPDWFAPFCLVPSLMIAMHSSCQLIAQSTFVFVVLPRLLHFGSLFALEWEPIRRLLSEDLFKDNLQRLMHLDLNASKDTFMRTQVLFLLTLAVALLLLSLAHHCNQVAPQQPPSAHPSGPRRVVPDTNHDLVLILTKSATSVCWAVKHLLVGLLLLSFVRSINVLDSVVFVTVVACLLFQTRASYSAVSLVYACVFVFRFLCRHLRDSFPQLQQHTVMLGCPFSPVWVIPTKPSAPLADHSDHPSPAQTDNFCMVVALFFVLRLESFFQNEVLSGQKTFKASKLSRLFDMVISIVRDSSQFVLSLKLFGLYFFTLLVPNTACSSQLIFHEYFSTITVLSLHLFAIKNGSRSAKTLFAVVLSLYCLFTTFAFASNYLCLFGSVYSSIDPARFESAVFNYGVSKTPSVLLPSAFKLILCLVSLKETVVHLFGKSDRSLSEGAFARIAKERFYFPLLKLVSLFFKEVIFILFSRDFLTPANAAKLAYMLLYLHYFNTQYRALNKVLEDFQFGRLLGLKVFYFKNYLMDSRFEPPEDELSLHDPLFEDLEVVYSKLFSRRLFTAFHQKAGRIWTYMLCLILGYLSVLFVMQHKGNNEFESSKIARTVVSFWENDHMVQAEHAKAIQLLFVTVFEVFFISVLKPKWTPENRDTAKRVPKALVSRYSRLFRHHPHYPGLVHALGLPPCPRLDQSVFDLKRTDFSSSNYQIEKYRSSPHPDDIDTLKKRLSSKQRLILLTLIRGKLAVLQFISAVVASFQRLVLLPFFIGLMQVRPSLFSLVFVALMLAVVRQGTRHQTQRMLNLSLSLLCAAHYLLATLFGQGFIGTNLVAGPKGLKLKLEWVTTQDSLSGHGMSLNYIILTKLFFALTVYFATTVFVRLDSGSIEFWAIVSTKTIRGSLFHVIKFRHLDNMSFWLLRDLMAAVTCHLSEILSVIALVAFYFVSGLIGTLAFTLFLLIKFRVTFGDNAQANDPLSPQLLSFYTAFALFNASSVLVFHLRLTEEWLCFHTDHTFFFPVLVVLSLLVVDCVQSADFQREKVSSLNYQRLLTRLSLHCQAFRTNEDEIISCAKSTVLDQLLTAKTQRFLSKADTLAADSEDLTHVSLFSQPKDYLQHLKRRMGLWSYTLVHWLFRFQKALVRQNSANENLFSCIGNFLDKNQGFLPTGYSLDYAKLVDFDFADLEQLIDQVEQSKAEAFQRESDGLSRAIKRNIDRLADTQLKATSPALKRISSPMTPGINSNVFSQLAKEFLSALNASQLEELIWRAESGQFGKDFFKIEVQPNEFIVVRDFNHFENSFIELNSVSLSLDKLASQLVKAVLLNVEPITQLVLVGLLCFGHGIMSMVYLAILVFGMLAQERIARVRAGQLLYLLFHANFLIVMALNSHFDFVRFDSLVDNNAKHLPPLSTAKVFLFLYGKSCQGMIVVVFTLVELNFVFLRKYASYQKLRLAIENKAQALYRLSASPTGLLDIFHKENLVLMAKVNTLETYLKQGLKQRLGEKEYTVELIDLSRRKTAVYRQTKEKLSRFLRVVGSLSFALSADNSSFEPSFLDSYLWRNLSYLNRRRSRDFHPQLLCLLTAILCFFFANYFSLVGKDHTVANILRNNEVDPSLSFNVTVMFLAICAERFLTTHTNHMWVDNSETEVDVVKRRLERVDSLNGNDVRCCHKTPRAHFQLVIRRLLNVLSLRRPSVVRPSVQFKHNPLMLRLAFSVVFFLYVIVLVFVVLPLSRNSGSSDSLWNRLFCNSFFRSQEENIMPQFECNSLESNVQQQLLLLLCVAYLVVSVCQIKWGHCFRHSFRPTSFNDFRDTLRFFCLKYSPFLREVRTVIDYSASSSCLTLLEWFQLEDIHCSLQHARLDEQHRDFSKGRLSKATKRLSGFSLLLFFFVLLIGPLYLFSDFMFNWNIESVQKASLNFSLRIGTNSYLLYENYSCQVSKMTDKNKQFRKLMTVKDLQALGPESFQQVSFNNDFHSQVDITRNSLDDLHSQFALTKTIDFELSLQVRTSDRGDLPLQFPFKIKGEQATDFFEMLSRPPESAKSVARFNIGMSPRLIDLRYRTKGSQDSVLDSEAANLMIFFMLVCKWDSASRRLSFELSDERNQGLGFVVLNKNIKRSVSLLQNFTNKRVSLKYVYLIILVYVGLDLVRNAFFSKSDSIWTTEVPNPYRLEEAVYLVANARRKGRFREEQGLFNKLIDYYRSPQDLKKLTGNFLSYYHKSRPNGLE
jgi:hypothetical protein